eukprot:TRINITY_DN6153_c0_g1_i2.p2 TRINITY_DN6153_c0_g1~~TRINITY_DN6153_c0_g1_i2.p2  ORF type:complete len:100 (-),score=21.27 TRINITY_DN6153_c0_g1_i2:138-437(-)
MCQDNTVSIHGITIYGSPYTAGMMAFGRTRDQLKDMWGNIPDHVDILMTHMPPRNILDKDLLFNTGCEYLASVVDHADIPLHVFGHIHGGYDFLVENLF